MKKKLFCIAVTAMVLFACSSGVDKTNVATDYTNAADTGGTGGNAPLPGGADYRPVADWNKKLVKKAEINISVNSYSNFDSRLHAGLQPYGAFITKEDQQSNEYKKANTVTIKVPVAQFDELLASLEGDSVNIISKKISSEEVSGEMVDIKSRILAKNQVRNKYLDLLKQAKNMKDIFDVQREINSVQEDIESAQGRLDYLQHQTAYSTIEVNYWQLLTTAPHEPGRLPRFITALKNALLTSVDMITGIIIFFVSLWPLVLIGTGVFYWWRKDRLKTAK